MYIIKMSKLTEVFRLTEFDKHTCYEFALKTKTVGIYPSEKHYTTNKLQDLGRHIHSERWGYHDNRGGAESFDNEGVITRIVYDYEGHTCFRPVEMEEVEIFRSGNEVIKMLIPNKTA